VSQVEIPVIANGDITSAKKAKQILDDTGASGVMVGRAAQGNPWIIGEINQRLQPVRIFKVTGTSTLLVTAVRISLTKISSCMSAEPAALLQTFLAGQPILISIISAPNSTAFCAESANSSTSD
jgi:tRNA-dihydrouridine synthase